MLLAIDPGIDTGWALWSHTHPGLGGLMDCGLGVPLLATGVHTVVIERPQVYPGARAEDPNDLITLAVQVGRYVERYDRAGLSVYTVLPRQWKGTLTKAQHHAQLANRVKIPPMADVPRGKRHNVLDAIGLALWAATAQATGHRLGRDGLAMAGAVQQ